MVFDKLILLLRIKIQSIMTPYQSLPNPPKTLSAGTILARLLDGIGFRYQLATEGLTSNEIDFRPTKESMDMMELLIHIYQLISWTSSAFDFPYTTKKTFADFDELRMETLELCQAFSAFLADLSAAEIEKASVYLKRKEKDYSFWYLINGPLADALTHIGQVNSWRRIAGNPVARISPFTGEAY